MGNLQDVHAQPLYFHLTVDGKDLRIPLSINTPSAYTYGNGNVVQYQGALMPRARTSSRYNGEGKREEDMFAAITFRNIDANSLFYTSDSAPQTRYVLVRDGDFYTIDQMQQATQFLSVQRQPSSYELKLPDGKSITVYLPGDNIPPGNTPVGRNIPPGNNSPGTNVSGSNPMSSSMNVSGSNPMSSSMNVSGNNPMSSSMNVSGDIPSANTLAPSNQNVSQINRNTPPNRNIPPTNTTTPIDRNVPARIPPRNIPPRSVPPRNITTRNRGTPTPNVSSGGTPAGGTPIGSAPSASTPSSNSSSSSGCSNTPFYVTLSILLVLVLLIIIWAIYTLTRGKPVYRELPPMQTF